MTAQHYARWVGSDQYGVPAETLEGDAPTDLLPGIAGGAVPDPRASIAANKGGAGPTLRS